MSVQQGPMGYDPSLTSNEQLVELRKRLQFYLDNGRDGTAVVESVREQIANIEIRLAANVETQHRIASELGAHAETNEGGIIAPGWSHPHSDDLPPAVSHRDQEHAATQAVASEAAEDEAALAAEQALIASPEYQAFLATHPVAGE